MAIVVYRRLFASKNMVHNKQLLKMVCVSLFFICCQFKKKLEKNAAASQLLSLSLLLWPRSEPEAKRKYLFRSSQAKSCQNPWKETNSLESEKKHIT